MSRFLGYAIGVTAVILLLHIALEFVRKLWAERDLKTLIALSSSSLAASTAPADDEQRLDVETDAGAAVALSVDAARAGVGAVGPGADVADADADASSGRIVERLLTHTTSMSSKARGYIMREGRCFSIQHAIQRLAALVLNTGSAVTSAALDIHAVPHTAARCVHDATYIS
jgi:hypothetical protein